MQELPLEPELPRPSVQWIARDRQVYRTEMDADLVRPSRFEAHAQECMLREELDEFEMRDRLADARLYDAKRAKRR